MRANPSARVSTRKNKKEAAVEATDQNIKESKEEMAEVLSSDSERSDLASHRFGIERSKAFYSK